MGEEFHMRFVKPRNGDIDPRLTEASNLLTEHGLTPEWLEHDQCLSVECADRNQAYVMEPFEGPGFQHLKLLGCRLFGPQCILASLNFKVELPQNKRPIYSVCMKGIVISCTSMDKKIRDHLHGLVELMAGEANRNLTDDVTHLVAGEVGSQKYAVGASRNTPIMTIDWVTDAWEIAQHRYVDCKEAAFMQKYRCPIFKGLVITVSGLTAEERYKVKKLVETEGGTYTGEMKMNECTHLILKELRGQKYDYATRWKIHIVNLSWVYDSLDKNYCQDEKKYPVTGTPGAPSIKTSTPERSRLSIINPCIADISAISTTHVDETAVMRTTGLSDVTLDPSGRLEVSQATVGPFLGHCRVFISRGVKGALLERCRKIINAVGATRSNKMDDNVTHVLMEDKVDEEINTLNDMELRPHVMNVAWLTECHRRSCHVPEASYLSPYVLVSDIELPKISDPKRTSMTNKSKRSVEGKDDNRAKPASSLSRPSSSSLSAAVPSYPQQAEGDMDYLLSQYLDDGSKEEDRTAQPIGMDEVDGSTSTSSRDQGTADQKGSHCHQTGEEHGDDDATQDPDSEVTTAAAEAKGVFGGKWFMFFGFSEDDEAALAEFVIQAGGSCVKGRRRVADFGVVPILGYPVEHTVGQVVTNAWLQMCIEAEEMLAVNSNPIFQPVDVDESSQPLQGCVLSISGYTGTERDCLNHIADVLGAVCQEFFVRKAKKSLRASTHLITKEPTGSKYNAAKKWNIPTLSKDWLFACAQSGHKEEEEKFNIDNGSTTVAAPPSSSGEKRISAAEPQGRRESTAHRTIDTVSNNHHHNSNDDNNDDAVPARGKKTRTEAQGKELASDGTEESGERTTVRKSTSSNKEATPQPSKSSRLAKEEDDAHTGRGGGGGDERERMQTDRNLVPSSSAESTKSNRETVPTSSASDREMGEGVSMDLANPMASAKALVEQQQGRCSHSQKENVRAKVSTVHRGPPSGKTATPTTTTTTTPAAGDRKKVHSRVEELQQQNRWPVLSPGLDSPSVFLAPGYRPKFDLAGVFEYLKSPDVPPKKRESLPLEEVFQHHLAEGVKNSAVRQNIHPAPSSSQSSQVSDDHGPLEGVVIAVGKKLGVNQTEYNTIVVELGGDYTWQYAPSCTHFIFQGRSNDLNKEYRQAKSQGKFIVSPYWLYACMEQRCRVDESMYPHNYNPNLNLGGVVKTETPGRGLRRSARSTPRSANDGTAKRTPARNTAINPRSTTASNASDAWQESLVEMQKWQQGGAPSSSRAPDDSGKKSLGSVVETSTSKRQETDRSPGKEGTESKERGGSSSPSSLSDEKSGDGSKDRDKEKEEEVFLPKMDPQAKQAISMEDGGSLEIREALSKTLESVKASSSRSKKSSKKRSRRGDGNSASGGPINTSGGNLSEQSTTTTHHASPWQTQQQARGGYLFTEAGQATESMGTEASQSMQITWDDPTGRREKERLAHKLEMVCGPSQNTEDFMANMDMPDLDETAPPVRTEHKSSRRPAQQVRSPTPEAPPLAFPTAKMVGKVLSPQPIDLLSDESSESQAEQSAKPIILTSGMAPQERIEFAEVIERLGGTVLEKQQFDPTCTHVVVVKPSRNEKFLAAVATGRWVLHKSYLIACRQEQRFVREEDHEWGNPAMSHLMQTLDSPTYSLVRSAHKWRQKVQAMRKSDKSCPGAYQGWRVILLTEQKKEDNFRRLLSAGGATVLNVRPPFTEVEATHCFVEMHKVKLAESDVEALVLGVTHVLKPEFIAAHLTDDPSPDPLTFTPPEMEKVRARLQGEQPRKRKRGDAGEAEWGKRSRR